MMGSTLGVDAFGNPNELTRLKGKRTRLEMELATVNDRIKRIENAQWREHQAERNSFVQSQKDADGMSPFGRQLTRHLIRASEGTMLRRLFEPAKP